MSTICHIYSSDTPFDYNFLFSETGVYTMHVKIWGENTGASNIYISASVYKCMIWSVIAATGIRSIS